MRCWTTHYQESQRCPLGFWWRGCPDSPGMALPSPTHSPLHTDRRKAGIHKAWCTYNTIQKTHQKSVLKHWWRCWCKDWRFLFCTLIITSVILTVWFQDSTDHIFCRTWTTLRPRRPQPQVPCTQQNQLGWVIQGWCSCHSDWPEHHWQGQSHRFELEPPKDKITLFHEKKPP